MKNLTDNQQEIINSIISEFESLNKPYHSDAGDYYDLLEYIDSAINEKERFLQEIKITNRAYEDANKQQVLQIVEKLNGLLNRFGYNCEFHYASNFRGLGISEYFAIRINWVGHLSDHKNTDVYFYSNLANKDGLWYLKDSSLTISKKYSDNQSKLDSVDELLKYVAELIIEKKKSLIK